MAQGGGEKGAWGRNPTATQPPSGATLEDIMSEEVAKNMQHRENVKYAEAMAAAYPAKEGEDEIPPELLLRLEREKLVAGGDFCDSDAIIAQMLQCQFDQEYGDMLKMSEKKKHGLYKYKLVPEHELGLQEPESETAERESSEYDGFEENERDFEEIPRCGYKLQDGKMITKHDSNIANRRNAHKVMAFPPEFQTGDGGAFDMRLPNRVFNDLKAHSRSEQSKKNKMLNRKESHATAELGIDEPTRLLLYKFVNSEMLLGIDGVIATGKESVVLHARCNPAFPDQLMPAECAIKVFKTTLNEFKTRDKYIQEDYRFKDRFKKLNPRKVIHMWAEKEMHNLSRMRKLGLCVPEVICLKKHVLMLSFIGDDHKAAPKLKDVSLAHDQWVEVYDKLVEDVHKLYNEGNLIHADLSEYNLLWHDKKVWFIDVSQSIEPTHPCALEFLLRDCTNIFNFFSHKDIPHLRTAEELFEHVTGMQGKDLAALERLRHTAPPSHKIIQETADANDDESKPPVYPFDYAWEKSKNDKIAKSKDCFVHHEGLRDEFDVLWNKTKDGEDEPSTSG